MRIFLKRIMVIGVLLNCSQAVALTEIATLGETIPFNKAMSEFVNNKIPFETAPSVKREKAKGTNAFFGENTNGFHLGEIKTHKIKDPPKLPIPIFIIGDDPISIEWARKNAKFFKKIKAMGFAAGIYDLTQLEALSERVGLPLAPENISGLSEIIGSAKYPVLINKGWLVQ